MGTKVDRERRKIRFEGFAKQFIIQGDDSISPQDFLRKARWHIIKLLQENPHTKVKCVLNCKMSRTSGKQASWIALPPDLENKKALINMKNEDHMCFKWCITRAKNEVAIHPERITPKLREQAEELNWDGCQFPMAVDKIKYFEARNPQISVNGFGWNGSIFPLKNIREEKECHVI